MKAQPDRLLTYAEAADVLSINAATLQRWRVRYESYGLLVVGSGPGRRVVESSVWACIQSMAKEARRREAATLRLAVGG